MLGHQLGLLMTQSVINSSKEAYFNLKSTFAKLEDRIEESRLEGLSDLSVEVPPDVQGCRLTFYCR